NVGILRHVLDQAQGEDSSAAFHDFLTVELERALGEETLYHTQVNVRVGTGIMLRSPYKVAPVLLGGIGFRYPFLSTLALTGVLEDQLAFPVRQDVPCGFHYCNGAPTFPVGGRVQHTGTA